MALEDYTRLRRAVAGVAEEMLSPVTRTKKQDWMTDDILVLMPRRRVF